MAFKKINPQKLQEAYEEKVSNEKSKIDGFARLYLKPEEMKIRFLTPYSQAVSLPLHSVTRMGNGGKKFYDKYVCDTIYNDDSKANCNLCYDVDNNLTNAAGGKYWQKFFLVYLHNNKGKTYQYNGQVLICDEVFILGMSHSKANKEIFTELEKIEAEFGSVMNIDFFIKQEKFLETDQYGKQQSRTVIKLRPEQKIGSKLNEEGVPVPDYITSTSEFDYQLMLPENVKTVLNEFPWYNGDTEYKLNAYDPEDLDKLQKFMELCIEISDIKRIPEDYKTPQMLPTFNQYNPYPQPQQIPYQQNQQPFNPMQPMYPQQIQNTMYYQQPPQQMPYQPPQQPQNYQNITHQQYQPHMYPQPQQMPYQQPQPYAPQPQQMYPQQQAYHPAQPQPQPQVMQNNPYAPPPNAPKQLPNEGFEPAYDNSNPWNQ